MLSSLFGLVERQVRRLVQAVEFLPGPGQIDAHAGCDNDGLTIPHGQFQVFTDGSGLFPHRLLRELPAQKHGKFIASQPSHHIAGVEQSGENPARLPDGLIARPMPKGIVDLLEVVQIYNKQRAGLLRLHRFQPFLDGPLHRRPIQESGEGVLGGTAQQFFQKEFLSPRLIRHPRIFGSHCRLLASFSIQTNSASAADFSREAASWRLLGARKRIVDEKDIMTIT